MIMEEKLRQAAGRLPVPNSTFSQIEERTKKNGRTLFLVRPRAVAALVCVCLLLGCTVAAATTECDDSAWASYDYDFSAVERAAKKLGITLPDTLGGKSFDGMQTLHVVPEGTSYLEAVASPAYRYCEVDYGEEYFGGVSITVGSTDNGLYRDIFSLDGSGTWVSDILLADSFRTEEYRGRTLQIGTCAFPGDDGGVSTYCHSVRWVDTELSVVFLLDMTDLSDQYRAKLAGDYAEYEPVGRTADEFPGELVECAKEVIDRNLGE